jgi:BirA family transcriptional regulator, biotin operon repressor / biotin---[acetyl-CoA-carboxylase] ligase
VGTADSLAPERLEPLLEGRFGRPYLYEGECGSTQDLVDPGLPEGAVALCEHQTEGRGRRGRAWVAPPGTAILCSVLLKPPGERAVPELTLVAGMAVAEAVERALTLSAQLKWPNDVMVNRRKVAGVLAEAREGAVVVGIGVNVNQTRAELPADAPVAPASLLTTDGVRRERAPILADLLRTLERAYDAWARAGLDAVYDGIGARDFLRGRRVLVDGLAGYGVGIGRDGRFEIDVGGERRVLESGDVRFER